MMSQKSFLDRAATLLTFKITSPDFALFLQILPNSNSNLCIYVIWTVKWLLNEKTFQFALRIQGSSFPFYLYTPVLGVAWMICSSYNVCPFSARCPIANARAKKFPNWQMPALPVPEGPMPGHARAQKICPLRITNMSHAEFKQRKTDQLAF